MSLPSEFNKIVVTKLSADFREATTIQKTPFKAPADNEVTIKIAHVGINASDINFTNGKYKKDVSPPFDAGFEAIGEIVAVGSKVTKVKVGNFAIVNQFGSFSEYLNADENIIIPVPLVKAELLPLGVSGMTASIALELVGQLTTKEAVLVTAAAGGTGQFAVQLAKLAGNHVIGTCSSDDKVEFLKKIGCDRVINYKKENLGEVLEKEYPNGVDIVYESVGGATFDTCVNNLAIGGRLIVIGMISGYLTGDMWKPEVSTERPLAGRLLSKSASVRGFFLGHFRKHYQQHLGKLFTLYKEGKIFSQVDGTSFKGLEQIADAIDHLYKGQNIGKVTVDLTK